MSSTADNLEDTYSEKLAEFAGELRDHIDDKAMLREIHEAIKVLLAGNGASEREIRRVLQQQLDSGEIRDESFELVQKLVDRIVLDASTANEPEGESDPFSSTTVIPTVTLDENAIDQHLQVGSVLRDRFMLQEEVSGGSMGTIYKALDRRLAEADSGDHWVAVKVLSPQLSHDGNALRALQQEAAKTRCLTHPNIVRFIDLDRDDDLYFMVMEWLEGRSLADVLDDSQNKKLDVSMSLDIIRQLGQALEFAHQRGVVHADVKPGNVMITADGEVKLFDFGVARIRQKQKKEEPDFDPGIMGAVSPAYSSMQVLTGEDPVPADDVFSLACLAYRMIAGYRVFGPRNAAEAADAGMEPQRLDCLGRSQWKALKKALSFSRITRYSSPASFIAALESDEDVGNDVEDTTETEALEQSRFPWRIVAVVLIFAAAVAAVMQTDLIKLLQTESSNLLSVESAAEGPGGPENQSTVAGESPAAEENTLTDSGAMPEATADVEGQEVIIPDPVVEYTLASRTEELTRSPSQPVATAAPTPNIASTTDIATTRPATVIIPLAGPGELPMTSRLTITEEGKAVVVDFVRESHLDESIRLRLVETVFSGSRSPLETGQYTMSNDGFIAFSAGQHRYRVIIEMSSDPVREQDVEVTLQVQDVDYSDIEFATLQLRLLDDDQRSFENSLTPDTVSFAVSQVAVRESDSAVQIDVIRYKPSDRPLEVAYTIRNVTATEGDDYVDPGQNTLSFAPGQRTARILIPLVQDSSAENNEAFMLELTGPSDQVEGNIFRRIAVMIRDDDS